MPSMRTFSLLALPALAAAHFHLQFPTERGFNEDTISNYPCGGYNTPSSNRTDFPLSGGPVWINNEHTSSLVQVVLAVGDSPSGNDFVYTMLPTVSEVGPDDFCVSHVTIPAAANVTNGTKGTIMVVTSGHGSSGGLYACADVVFVNKNLTSEQMTASCKTSEGVQYFQQDQVNANGSASITNATANGDDGGAGASTMSASLGLAIVAGAAVVAAMF